MSDPIRTVDHSAAPPSTSSVADLNATTGGEPIDSSPVAPPVSSDRYVLGDEIAHGGMGVVYRATDTVLGREVAVKVLKDKFAPQSGVAHRFTDEARIAAQLQHPGIPPVHDLGTLPDGRPFLAMKLIKGRTLDELLAARPNVSADRGRDVAAFEQVCHAVAYAHAHKVIHRDLKPANIMVGAFSEVQVMDWGLAKVLTSGGVDPRRSDPDATSAGTEVVSLRDSDGSFTQAGSVLGTPAFMPPEQAVGAIGKVDARSDVFGLGAILAVILTGHPPFAGTSAETSRLQAAQGKVDECFARLDECGAEQELVALCKRCLSPNISARPAHAGEVAAVVGSFRAAAEERARRAELDRARAEVRAAEQRKRRKVQLALASAVVLLLAGGGGAAWWADRQQADRRRERELDATKARLVADGAVSQAEAVAAGDDRAAADAALALAEQRSADVDAPDLQLRLQTVVRDRDLVRELDQIFERRWTMVQARYDRESALREYPVVFRRWGLAVGEEPPDVSAAKVQQARVAEAVVTGLGEWLVLAPDQPGLRALLDRIDPHPDHVAVRAALASKQPDRIRALADRIDPIRLPAGLVIHLADNPALARSTQLRLLEEAWAARPTSYQLAFARAGKGLVWLAFNNQPVRADDVIGWCRTAVALRPTSAHALGSLAGALEVTGDRNGSLFYFRRAAEVEPDDPASRLSYAKALNAAGQHRAAVAVVVEALRYNPAWADDKTSTLSILAQLRFHAAKFAVQAATGGGIDPPPEADRAALRADALRWLTADLAAWRQYAAPNTASTRRRAHSFMRMWRTDPDLKLVRPPDLQYSGYAPAERDAWARLWEDVVTFQASVAPREAAPPPRAAK